MPIINLALWELEAERLDKIKQAIKFYKAQEEQALEQLKALSGGQTASGRRYDFILSIRPGSIDYSKIPELSGVVLEPYRKPDVIIWALKEKVQLPVFNLEIANQPITPVNE